MRLLRLFSLPKLWTRPLIRRKRPRPALSIQSLESRRVLAAEFNLLGDYNSLEAQTNPAGLTVVGSNIFFTAQTSDVGTELWKTNGNVGNNTLVKDIRRLSQSSDPTQLINVGGTLFFVANDGTNGPELWKSDGTADGTSMVADITPGSAGTTIAKMTNFGGTLFFTANTSSGVELWKSDGTTAGTLLVKDINAGAVSSNPDNLLVIGPTMYFIATEFTTGTRVWKTDGTSAGTVLAINLGFSPKSLTNVNGQLVYSHSNNWLAVSDGTQAGTSTFSLTGTPASLTNVNGVLYFSISSSLWKSNLTEVGTTFIRTLNAAPKNLTAVGNTLYFVGKFTDSSFDDLGKSDGTAAGTVAVAVSSRLTNLTNVNGTLYYHAQWSQLWRTDGTTAGTVEIIRFPKGGNAPSITELISSGTTVFLATPFNEIYRSDGTNAGTVKISDGIAISDSSNFTVAAERNGELYIAHTSGLALINSQGIQNLLQRTNTGVPINVNNEIYHVAGNLVKASGAAGPQFLKSFERTATSVANVNGTLYFVADDGTSGAELWKSDGTTAGTVLVKDIWPGTFGSYPRYLTNVNGTLFFSAKDNTNGTELWKSNGTAAGTVIVRDIASGSVGSYPRELTAAGNVLYFSADNRVNSFELWRSDGTASGTVMVQDINPGIPSSFPSYLTYVNSLPNPTLFFSAATANGRELWSTLVATNFTSPVLDIQPGSGDSNPRYMTEVAGTVYFAATSAAGRELWRTNGSAGGTSQVRDIVAGTNSSSPSRLINFNGTLYFAANDEMMGDQLWKSNGTAIGTVPIQNPDGSRTPDIASGLWTVGNRLYFGGRTRLYGIELFVLSDVDYGDAATQTTFSQNGARHTAIGPMLGSLRDTSEPNGLPSSSATGDDTNGSDDEDLFASPIQLERNATVNLSLPVTGATTRTRLSGWFDWNLDGDWDDANEKVVSDLAVVNGANTVSINVPAAHL